MIGKTFSQRGTTYHYCTGYEGQKGICWWCGKPFQSKRVRHCCCPECTSQYERHFCWNVAKKWALKRADYTCSKCGRKLGYKGYNPNPSVLDKSDIEVHHIIPVNGSYGYSHLNCPCLLQVLCLECHGKTRHKDKKQEETSQAVMVMGI